MSDLVKRAINRLQFSYYGARTRLHPVTRVRHEGQRLFQMITSSAEATHRALKFSLREPETLNWIDSFPKDAIFYDVGANVGVYSLYCKSRHPHSRVLSFEPEALSFSDLCKNIHMNGLSDITPYPFAVSDKSEISNLNVSVMSAGAGAASITSEYLFQPAKDGKYFKQGTYSVSIDDLIEKSGFPVPNYLKIDVDGIEQSILSGATKTLASAALVGLLVEFQYESEADLDEIIQTLRDRGLELSETSQWLSGVGSIKSKNYIFRRI